MKIYIVKIASEDVVEEILSGHEFIHDGIYNFEAQLQLGDPVIIYFGGDKAQISWSQGIRGVGQISALPFDKGYDPTKPKNFKIKIQPINVLESSIPPKAARTHSRLAADIYDIPYIGANHFPTQAISSFDDPAGIKALAHLYNEYGYYDFGYLLEDIIIDDSKNGTLHISDFSEVASSLQSKPFLILTGLSGSGKTLQALSFVKWLTPIENVQDIFHIGAEIRSANVTYLVGRSDHLAVEFWNSSDPDEAVKVTLPREMIAEWAKYIQEHNIPKATQACEIREAVKGQSKFSDQLHSFETHLKAAAFALIDNEDKFSESKGYELLSVGADWTSNENLLGYPDALNPGHYRKPDNGVLDLILNAQRDEEHPYFLILDEMNLSHVERYFADFLSAMESGEPIHLHEDTEEDWNGVPAKLKIPDNLFVIGTVNIDETTYMFSPKVLDRANVIEFRVDPHEMEAFLDNPVKPNLDAIAGQGAAYAKSFAAAARRKDVPLDEDLKTEIRDVLMSFFNPLQEAGAEFGYRTAHEICRFVYFHKELSGDDWSFESAMDAAVMQKLLPKLHGSKKKLGPVLETLMRLCLKTPPKKDDPLKEEHMETANVRYPASLEKLKRMEKRLQQHGFTSFAEA